MTNEAAENFLVPNATFFVELFAFALIVFVIGRYIIPPINKAMTDRQNAIRKEFAGTRGRVKAAVEARPRGVTFEEALAQVQRFSKLSGKSDQERKSIA